LRPVELNGGLGALSRDAQQRLIGLQFAADIVVARPGGHIAICN
jgi:hypothetical protein